MMNCQPQTCQCPWCRMTEPQKISALLSGIENSAETRAQVMPHIGNVIRGMDVGLCREMIAQAAKWEIEAVLKGASAFGLFIRAAGAVLIPLIEQRLKQLQAEAAAKAAGGGA